MTGPNEKTASSSGLSQVDPFSIHSEPRRFPLKQVSIGAVILCGVIATQVAFLKFNSSESTPTTDATAAASAPTAATAKPEPLPVAEPVATEAPQKEPADAEDNKELQKLPAKKKTAVRWKPVSPATTKAQGAADAATAAAPSETAPSKSATKNDESPRVNAWDLDAFGDRH
jgi:hypothetical protein